MDRVGEHFGEVTLFVSVFIHAVAEEFIANEAHMLTFHAHMLTRHIHITFVTPKVAVLIVAITHLLVADCAIMVIYLVVSTVDDSVATVAVIVLVFVYVITNEFSAAFIFVAVAIVVIIPAIEREPYFAPVAGVVVVVVLVQGVIGVLFAGGFLTASVAERILVIIDMTNAFEFVAANFTVAHAIFILLNTNVYQPYRASVAVVVIVFINVYLVTLFGLTVSRIMTFIKREGTYVYLLLIHIVAGQKPTQHCKAIILQLKKK